MEMYDTVTDLQPQVIVGEQEAGAAAKARNQLNKLIKGLSGSTFDVMDLAYDIKSNGYFKPKYNTFAEYGKTLDLKLSKLYYLVKIREVMNAAGVPRETYEPIGLSKLRAISRLDPNACYDGGPCTETLINNLVTSAATKSLDEIKQEVATIQGLTGDDSLVWLNISLKHSAREVVRKAIAAAKKNIGSVSKDDEGISKDATDGAAIEAIALDFLSDPVNSFEIPDDTGLDKDV
jgi:hypothetical protein